MRRVPTPYELRAKIVFSHSIPRQYPFIFQRRIGSFILDFLWKRELLGVEIDGEIHQRNSAYDTWRDAILLEKYGVAILRFANSDISERPRFVVGQIKYAILERACRR